MIRQCSSDAVRLFRTRLPGLWPCASVSVTLIDPFDSEPAFCGERGDVSLDRIVNALAIVSWA